MKITGSTKIMLGAATALAMMFTSVHAANASDDPPPTSSYSAAELFEGLLLNSGPLADEHPEVLLDPSSAGVIDDQAADTILALIDDQHPDALDDFSEAMASSDPYTVRQGLYNGRDVLMDVLTPKTAAPGTVTPMADTVCSLTACAVTFLVLAFFIAAVVALKAAPGAAFSKAETPSQTLELDEWVARIMHQVG